jgi:hypothetical protein
VTSPVYPFYKVGSVLAWSNGGWRKFQLLIITDYNLHRGYQVEYVSYGPDIKPEKWRPLAKDWRVLWEPR